MMDLIECLLRILTDGHSSAEVVMRVAWRVHRASLGGVRAAVVVGVVADEAPAFGRALRGIAHDHHGGIDT